MRRVLCAWLQENSSRLPSARPSDRETASGERQAAATAKAAGQAPAETAQERDLRRAEVALQVAQDFSPTAGLEPFDFPRSLLLDITGLEHLFSPDTDSAANAAAASTHRARPTPLPYQPLPYQGQTPGERVLVARLHQALRRQGLAASMAVADTLGAAWAWAHYGPALLAARGDVFSLDLLPVAALRLTAKPLERLDALGLERIGQLRALPRAALPSRLGAEVLLRLEQLEGSASEVIAAYRPPALATAERSLEFPVASAQMLEALLAQLLVEAIEALPPGQGVEQLVCRLRDEGGRWIQFAVGLYQATARADHLLGLVRLRLETLPLSRPIETLQVEIPTAGELAWQQRELFEPRPDTARHRALLIDRLSTRLGRRAVLRARCIADAQPEFACRLEPLIPPRLRGTMLCSRRQAAHRPRRRTLAKGHWHSGNRSHSGKGGHTSHGAYPGGGSAPVADPWLRPWRLFARPTPVEVVSVAPDGPPQSFAVRGRFRPQGEATSGSSARLLPIVRYWGPERIETAWWRGQMVRRDYYRIETADGRWFWLFRDLRSGRWFCHGSFD